MGITRRIGAVGVAGLAAVGLTLVGPGGVASAADSCKAGSRNASKTAAKASDMREVETLFIDGSNGHAEVTLRYSESLDCAWGLLEGTGQIWVEQKSPDGTFNRLYWQRLDKTGITHTAAANPVAGGAMRVCGNTFDGSVTTGSGSSSDGKSASGSSSDSSTISFTQPRCTQSLGGAM